MRRYILFATNYAANYAIDEINQNPCNLRFQYSPMKKNPTFGHIFKILISSTCDSKKCEENRKRFGTFGGIILDGRFLSRTLHANTEDMYIFLPTWCYLD